MKSLEGKFIRVFCAGGWEIDGQVISEGKTRILLKNKNEFLIYKESISLIEFIDVSNRDKDTKSVKGDKGEVLYPENSLNYNNYSVGLPESLLSKPLNKGEEHEDLGVYFGSSSEKSLNFGVKGESETEED